MNRKVYFSFIVPVYNAGKYLHRCIDSLVGQSFDDFEVILVDDGSTDESGKICDEYASRFFNISTIHICNSGVSVARNEGLKISSGKWVWFVDADDWVEKTTLSLIHEFIIDENTKSLFWNFIEEYENEKCIEDRLDFSVEQMGVNAFIQSRNPSMVFQFLFRKDILLETNILFTEGVRCGEDVEFLMKYLSYIDSIEIINRSFYHYFIHGESVMRKQPNYLRMSDDLLGVVERLLHFWKINNIPFAPWMKNQFEKRYVSSLVYLCKSRPNYRVIMKRMVEIKKMFLFADKMNFSYRRSLKLTNISLIFTLFFLYVKINYSNSLWKK